MDNSVKKKWKRESITSVADFVRGVSYKKELSCLEAKDGYQAILRANNISDGCVCMEDLVFVPMDMVKSVQKLVVGDVLIAMSSGSKNVVGKAAMIRQQINASFGTFCGVLRPKNGILPPYFGYFFQSSGYRHTISSLAAGVNINNIKLEHFSSIEIPLPPIDEQKRIVAKLDSLLDRVESCRAHLDRAAAAIKRFRLSALSLAISTPLFIGENAGEIWNPFYLKDVADIQLGKMLDKAKNRGKEVDYLRNVNVRWFSFDLGDVKKMRLPESELENFSVKNGDVFICEGGEPGRAAVWRNGENHFAYQKALHRVRLSDKILPEWLVFCLKVDAEKSSLDEYFTGTTIKHLTGVALKRYRFLAPSIKAQRLIVEKIEKLMKFADELEEKINAGRERVESLTSSILAKAFRGELV